MNKHVFLNASLEEANNTINNRSNYLSKNSSHFERIARITEEK